MNEVKPPEYAPGDPNDPTAVLREIRELLDRRRFSDAHGVLLRFRDHWAEVVAATSCGHDDDSPNFTPDTLRELEARGFVRVNVPRRESPTPVDLSPLSPERLVKATEDVMRQKTSEVERAATDAGSIAAVDSAGAKAAGALPIARQRSSDEACKAQEPQRNPR